MNGELTIDREVAGTKPISQPAVIRFFAHLFSYVFHPLFIPLYVTYFLIYIHPDYFSGFSGEGRRRLMMLLFIDAVLFPAITVLLLKALKFIDSVFLRTQKDRIIPYIAAMTFYFWAQYVLRETRVPGILVAFMFGVFISTSAALLANIYFKISMHGIGVGGLVGIFLVILQQNTMLMTWPLALVILLAGLVCTSRMIVSDHSPKEIYSGLLVGVICQFIGAIVHLSN